MQTPQDTQHIQQSQQTQQTQQTQHAHLVQSSSPRSIHPTSSPSFSQSTTLFKRIETLTYLFLSQISYIVQFYTHQQRVVLQSHLQCLAHKLPNKQLVLVWDDIAKSSRFDLQERCYVYVPYDITRFREHQSLTGNNIGKYCAQNSFIVQNLTLDTPNDLHSGQNKIFSANLSDIDKETTPNMTQTSILPTKLASATTQCSSDYRNHLLPQPFSHYYINPHQSGTTIINSLTYQHHKHRTSSFKFPSNNIYHDLLFITKLLSILALILENVYNNTTTVSKSNQFITSTPKNNHNLQCSHNSDEITISSKIPLRDLYYSNPALYTTQSVSNAALYIIQSMLRCPRDVLGIVMSERGLCYGGMIINVYQDDHGATCPLSLNMSSFNQIASSNDNTSNFANFYDSSQTHLNARKRKNIGAFPVECTCPTRLIQSIDFSQQPRGLFHFPRGMGNSRYKSVNDVLITSQQQLSYQISFIKGKIEQNNSNCIDFCQNDLINDDEMMMTEIPYTSKNHLNVSTPHNFMNLVVIEKETIFTRLVESVQKYKEYTTNMINKNITYINHAEISQFLLNSILITSKGYPNITARNFIYNITDSINTDHSDGFYPRNTSRTRTSISTYENGTKSLTLSNFSSFDQTSPINQVILVDGDPYGIEIAVKYIIGTPKQTLDCPFSLQYLSYFGIRPSIVHSLCMIYDEFHPIEYYNHDNNDTLSDNRGDTRDFNISFSAKKLHKHSKSPKKQTFTNVTQNKKCIYPADHDIIRFLENHYILFTQADTSLIIALYRLTVPYLSTTTSCQPQVIPATSKMCIPLTNKDKQRIISLLSHPYFNFFLNIDQIMDHSGHNDDSNSDNDEDMPPQPIRDKMNDFTTPALSFSLQDPSYIGGTYSRQSTPNFTTSTQFNDTNDYDREFNENDDTSDIDSNTRDENSNHNNDFSQYRQVCTVDDIEDLIANWETQQLDHLLTYFQHHFQDNINTETVVVDNSQNTKGDIIIKKNNDIFYYTNYLLYNELLYMLKWNIKCEIEALYNVDPHALLVYLNMCNSVMKKK